MSAASGPERVIWSKSAANYGSALDAGHQATRKTGYWSTMRSNSLSGALRSIAKNGRAPANPARRQRAAVRNPSVKRSSGIAAHPGGGIPGRSLTNDHFSQTSLCRLAGSKSLRND